MFDMEIPEFGIYALGIFIFICFLQNILTSIILLIRGYKAPKKVLDDLNLNRIMITGQLILNIIYLLALLILITTAILLVETPFKIVIMTLSSTILIFDIITLLKIDWAKITGYERIPFSKLYHYRFEFHSHRLNILYSPIQSVLFVAVMLLTGALVGIMYLVAAYQ